MATKSAKLMVLTTALVVALAGCNNSDPAPQGTGAVNTPIDACAVVTAADAEAVLGGAPTGTVEFPFRIRAVRTIEGVSQPEFLGQCNWVWEVPAGEGGAELAQLQFTVWGGDTFYSDPPINEGDFEPIDVGDRGVIVDVPEDDDVIALLTSFVTGNKTVWLDATTRRNPQGRADLIDLARRVAADLG